MPPEPDPKRAVAFIDGQNLYYAAKDAFGHRYPNYDVKALAKAVCAANGWELYQARFYTGVPDRTVNPDLNHFWVAKMAQMGREGIHTYSRRLKYRNKTLDLPDGTSRAVLVGDEKGIDIRIALDVIRLAHRRVFDVALIFSQDQDFSEVADEIRTISREQHRWIKPACAFPVSPTYSNQRGINNTEWCRIDRATYDACLDPRDYRPKPKP